jgi:dTMP kinase
VSEGRFITFEGIEGSGKTTQIERLASRLRRAGVDPVVTREPGATALGRELRAILLRPSADPPSPLTELLLYVADRAHHVDRVVGPALGSGRVVLCDRYRDATLAYQGYGRGIALDRIRELHASAPLDLDPQRTLLLDLEPEAALGRARTRDRSAGLESTQGRFEEEPLEFHRRVREGYRRLAAASPQRFRVLDASGSADRVERLVLQAVADLLPAVDRPS